MTNFTLFVWGSVLFKVYPLNILQVEHHTETDWSKKEIAGAASYREWVGENDENITLTGKVFPHYMARRMKRPGNPTDPAVGGLRALDMLDNMRRLGQAHTLVRGDGWHFGWFVIENMRRGHTELHLDGIGQQIDFTASFQRVPVPNDPAAYFQTLWSGTV
jgi:phage protein U